MLFFPKSARWIWRLNFPRPAGASRWVSSIQTMRLSGAQRPKEFRLPLRQMLIHMCNRGKISNGSPGRWPNLVSMKWQPTSVTSAGWLLCSFLFLVGFAEAIASPNDAVFAEVVNRARTAAAKPYQVEKEELPKVLQQLNYDTYRMITFRREEGLWFGDRSRFQVQLFHPGYIYKEPVRINQVVDGKVEPVDFGTKFFRYPRFDPALLQNARLGFAGFRLLYPLAHAKPVDEVVAFVGASYFRALAASQVYGISARGLAIDTADNLPEEFPSFREFWLCKPLPDARDMEFFALLDSTSVSGAYRFRIKPGKKTTLDVEAQLF